MKLQWFWFWCLPLLSGSCKSADPLTEEASSPIFYVGADLSYVNEMEDCGAVYKTTEGLQEDPYTIFASAGANTLRVRLWHSPQWTDYSNLEDVKESLRRAKNQGMYTLLAFHYSDTWADPHQQQIPAAWFAHINHLEALSQLVYDYTLDTLEELYSEGLAPDIVQIGNEVNAMILQDGTPLAPMNWSRNSQLLKKGIQAVRDFSTQRQRPTEIMLHIAQPENALWWFEEAAAAGIRDFDWIGLSYYPRWSRFNLSQAEVALEQLIQTHQKKLMVVETAYPYTLENQDQANNILHEDALIDHYPATEVGQLNYLQDLKSMIQAAGGSGLLYWEPAWVSTPCSTLWGTGSHWDNATLFKSDGTPTAGMNFFQAED